MIIGKSTLKIAVVVIVAVSGGALAGLAINSLRAWMHEADYRESRAQAVQHLVANRTSLSVGTFLNTPNLYDREGKSLSLADAIHGRSLVLVLHPNCGSCTSELTTVIDMIPQPVRNRLVLLTRESDLYVDKLKGLSGGDIVILQDRNADWISTYGISAFPLYIEIDKNVCIQRIYGAGILDSEIESFLDAAASDLLNETTFRTERNGGQNL